MDSSRCPGSAARHSRTGTMTSPTMRDLGVGEQVVDLAHGPEDDVLDGHDAGRVA